MTDPIEVSAALPPEALSVLEDNENLILALLDADLNVIWAGPGFARIAGAESGDLVGVPLEAALMLETGLLERPKVYLKTRGRGFFGATSGTAGGHQLGLTLSRCGDGVLLQGEDRSGEFRLREELARATSRDDLTGLLRRAFIVDEMDRARAAGIARGLILVDLDQFKQVNDNAGHLAGDNLLQLAAARLTNAVRKRDAVARIGGDEFAIFVHRPPDAESLTRIGEAIVASLGSPFELHGRRMDVGCSVGAVLDFDGSPSTQLFADADAALYSAKAAGRGRFVLFDEQVAAKRDRQLALEEDLRQAVPLEQIQAASQSIFRLSDLSLHSYEVLARWRRPGHGVLSASAFIETASDLNLTKQITESALRHALRAHGGELSRPGGPSLAINIDPPSLAESGFRNRLARVLAGTGICPERITLEVTERDPLPLTGPGADMLHALARAGFGVAVDDFGSGASSLGYFADLPISQVKIDRSLTARVDSDPKVAMVVLSLVELAARLRLEVVAEGIETPAQLKVLRDMGCQLGQGFLLGRPQLVSDDPAPDAVAQMEEGIEELR